MNPLLTKVILFKPQYLILEQYKKSQQYELHVLLTLSSKGLSNA